MRTLKIFIYVYALNCVFWLLPFRVYHQDILETHNTYDSYRYITAAVMTLRGEGIHPELINNPLPVLWAYLWFHAGFATFQIAQCFLYAVAASYLLKASDNLSIPSWMMLVSICNPIIATYIGAPSKEFFGLVSTMATLGWLLKERHGFRETLLMLAVNAVALAVRPPHLIFIAAMVLAFRFPRHRIKFLAITLLILLFIPKSYDDYAALNADNVSTSPIMQAFREMCVHPGILPQILTSPLRMIFYMIYPFPHLNIFSFLGKAINFDLYTYYYRASVEAMGLLVYLASGFAMLKYRAVHGAIPRSVITAARSLGNYYLMAMACLAVAEPFPHARYRIVALFGLPFLFLILTGQHAQKRRIPISQEGYIHDHS